MKPLREPILPVLALCLLAAWPFLTRSSLPHAPSDTPLHVFRAAELSYSLRAGDLYPRWAPDYYYGYGYPVFNFYAPLTAFAASLLSIANPYRAVFGVKMVFIIGFLFAGFGMFWLVRRRAGPAAGILSAGCFLFTPYIFLINPHMRGAVAEFFAVAIAPLCLWALAAFADDGQRRHFVLASLLTAATILSHNLIGPMIVFLAAGNLVWRSAFEVKTSDVNWSQVGMRFLPVATGGGLAAFFWLPAVLERHTVQLYNVLGSPHFQYRSHFLTLGELLGPSVLLDLGAGNPEIRFNLGLPQWLLAAAGLCALVILAPGGRCDGDDHQGTSRSRDQLHDGLFWAAALVGLCFLMTSLSAPVWRALRPMAFLMFPWRLLGPAGLCAAMLAGYSTRILRTLPSQWRQRGFGPLLALPLVGAMPIFVPPYWQDFGPTNRWAMIGVELRGIALGTTAVGEYLPASVREVPAPAPDIIEAYRRGGVIDRIDRRTIPDGASVTVIEQAPSKQAYHISSAQPFTLDLRQFMFAGWHADLDGNPLEIQVALPHGFMRLAIPSGEHTLTVRFTTTRSRMMGWVVTIMSLLAVLVVSRSLPSAAVVTPPSETRLALPAFAVLGLFVALTAVVTRLGVLQPHSVGLEPRPAQHLFHQPLEGGIDLLGYDLIPCEISAGRALMVNLYWKAREAVRTDYQVFVHFTDDSQRIWSQSDKLHPADYPTSRWNSERYIRDRHTLQLPPDIPPGVYSLRVGLWRRSTRIRQPVLDGSGAVVGDAIRLPSQVRVTAP